MNNENERQIKKLVTLQEQTKKAQNIQDSWAALLKLREGKKKLEMLREYQEQKNKEREEEKRKEQLRRQQNVEKQIAIWGKMVDNSAKEGWNHEIFMKDLQEFNQEKDKLSNNPRFLNRGQRKFDIDLI